MSPGKRKREGERREEKEREGKRKKEKGKRKREKGREKDEFHWITYLEADQMDGTVEYHYMNRFNGIHTNKLIANYWVLFAYNLKYSFTTWTHHLSDEWAVPDQN